MTELMRRRRALMGASQGGILPSGYRQVSAIRIPEGGIIPTGLYPTLTSQINIVARINSALTESRAIWYSRGSGSGDFYYLNATASTQKYCFQVYTKYIMCSGSDNSKHVFFSDFRNRKITIDGDEFSISHSTYIDVPREILLAARQNQAGTGFDQFADLTIWAYSHSSDTQRTQTLIPCQQLSNNEYGLFDLEGNVFIGNIGSGIITEDNT